MSDKPTISTKPLGGGRFSHICLVCGWYWTDTSSEPADCKFTDQHHADGHVYEPMPSSDSYDLPK